MNLLDFAAPSVGRTFYFDCETHAISRTNPCPRFVCLQYAYDNDAPTIVGGDADGKAAAYRIFREALADPNTTLVAHNGFYDYSIMLGLDGYWRGTHTATDEDILSIIHAALAGRIRDTLVMSKLNAIEYDWLEWDRVTRERSQFSLAYLVKRFTGRLRTGKDKDDMDRVQVRYHEMDGLAPHLWPEDFRTYALEDITDLRDVYGTLNNNTYADERFQTAIHWVMRLMELWGIHTNKANVQKLKDIIEPAIHAANDDLLALGLMRPGASHFDQAAYEAFVTKLCDGAGIPVLRTSTGRVSRAAGFISKLKCPMLSDPAAFRYTDPPTRDMAVIRQRVVDWYTARGLEVPLTEKAKSHEDDFYGSPDEEDEDEPTVSTARDVLEATDDPALLRLAQIGKYKTLASTFIPTMELGFEHPIHPRWNGLVATGRPSCTRPNLLNQPRELEPGVGGIRECYVARQGYVYLDPDYTQAELCSLAQVCYDKFGFSAMRDVIRAGYDIHVWFAAMMAGVDYAVAFAGYMAGDKKYKDLRQLAKAANFGFPGGLGIKKFVKWARKTYGVTLSESKAKQLKVDWLAAFPEIRLYFEWVNEQIKHGYDGKSFTFVQHRSNRRRGGVRFCNGANTGFQGLTADGAKNALLKVFVACHTPSDALYGSRIVAFIYDEILIETPENMCGPASVRLIELLRQGMEEYTPDVPATVTIEAMFAWSKKAKAVRNADGMLMPCDMRPS